MVKSVTIKMMDYEIKLELKRVNIALEGLTKRLDEVEKKMNPVINLLDSSEVMKLIGVSERTLATYRKKGRIQYVKIDGTIRYPQSAISSLVFNNLKN